jgi:hypothetical protein
LDNHVGIAEEQRNRKRQGTGRRPDPSLSPGNWRTTQTELVRSLYSEGGSLGGDRAERGNKHRTDTSLGTAREADRKGETGTQEVLGKGVVD